MLDDLQSKYDGTFTTERKSRRDEESLRIGRNDDWVLVVQEKGELFKVMYKEDGYRGSPEERKTVDSSDVESTVAEFVEFL